MISSQGLFSTGDGDDEIITAGVVPDSGQGRLFQDASSGLAVCADGVFVVKTKGGDIRVAATRRVANGVIRVPAIEAALKANWSPGALDSVKISADGLLADIHGSSAYRANLIKVMAQRAVAAAVDRFFWPKASGAQQCAPLCI